MQINLINNYLNGYTNKLSLQAAVTKDGLSKNIDLDKSTFEKFTRDVNFNPMSYYLAQVKNQKVPLVEVYR